MIKAIITDFDGTLVDTFEANLLAYQRAFHSVGLTLTAERYRRCFGFRFERFMSAMGVFDDQVAAAIKEAKRQAYPQHFDRLRLNRPLLSLIEGFKSLGGLTAIASTARKENLMNAVNYLGIAPHFNLIYAGADVRQGKPSPEIYDKAMAALGVQPAETLIFEDSPVGLEAAKASGASYILVTEQWFSNGN